MAQQLVAEKEVTMPNRIQRKRTKGWRMPENAVSVTRPGRFGNPFTIARAIDAGISENVAAEECVFAFRSWLEQGSCSPYWFSDGEKQRNDILKNITSIRGKSLACFCPLDQPCHADVLLEIANRPIHAKEQACLTNI